MQGHTSTSRLVAFIIHPKQINEYSNIDKRYRGLINIPGNPFLCWIFEASNSLFHISWVLCSNPSQTTIETLLTLSTASPISSPLLSFSESLPLSNLTLLSFSLQLKISFPILSSFWFVFPTIPTAATFSIFVPLLLQPPFMSLSPCSHLFCFTPSAATFPAPLLLQLQKARLIPHGH